MFRKSSHGKRDQTPGFEWTKVCNGRKKRVSLKTINVVVEDDHDEECEETLWFDFEEFDCHEPSFFAAKGRGQEELQMMDVDDNCSDVTSVHSDFSQLSNWRVEPSTTAAAMQRQQKRIIWGEEVPLVALNAGPLDATLEPDSYVMTLGANPMITIRPTKGAESAVDLPPDSTSTVVSTANSAATSGVVQSGRVLKLEHLRNYFQLTAPVALEPSHLKSRYFLSLLDPTMPRLTNCGYYYRMRYAVYVLPRQATRSMNVCNWRKQGGTSKAPIESLSGGGDHHKNFVLHIGEMHLYTIFPKEGGKHRNPNREWIPQWCLETPGYIHYENISFFVNQTPLNAEEQSILRATENDINQMIIHFRRYLKDINSAVTGSVASSNPGEINCSSTFLLEQLKYPKSSDQFTNPDRICEQFVRNQMDMFAHYDAHFSGKVLDTKDTINSCAPAPASAAYQDAFGQSTLAGGTGNDGGGSKDWLNGECFLAKLHRLRNQAERKPFEP